MPRATQSPAAGILKYFRTAPMENAELVLDLSKAAVKERQERAEGIREAQVKAAKKKTKLGTANIPAGVLSPATPAKKSHKAKAKGTKGKPGPKPGSHRKQGNGTDVGEPATVNDSSLPPQGDQTGLDLE
jgi:hypothetical protein